MVSIKSLQMRGALHQILRLGITLTSVLIIWKLSICFTTVVLSGSMEPGFRRGDILFYRMSKDPIRVGEIVLFKVDGEDIPIVHRVIKVHEKKDTGEVDILTKGDNNRVDDIVFYPPGQRWLGRRHIMGRAVGFLPYFGYLTVFATDYPIIKYILIGVSLLLEITSTDQWIEWCSRLQHFICCYKFKTSKGSV